MRRPDYRLACPDNKPIPLMTDSGTFTISGAQGGTPNRLEIHNFVKNTQFFSLYIQALQQISSESQSALTSFFSIAGIHGLPYVPWDNSGGAQAVDDNNGGWEGYCTHGNVLFPTFHRPFVALFEQAIQTAAIQIASAYTVNGSAFRTAAQQLRQPYWDWAANALPPPEVISLDEVNITVADGSIVSVANPLRRYTFHPLDPSFYSPWNIWNTTVRHADRESASAGDDVTDLKNTLTSAFPQIRSSTHSLFLRVHTWPGFSNHSPGDGGSTSNSLEAIHDMMHNNIGGLGHMSDPAVAAFDPIFWLHHANVDRLLALWSAVNPGVWVSPGEALGGTWTLLPTDKVDGNTALTPFWRSETEYWASNDVNTTSVVGYTYPEFNGLDMGNPTKLKSAILAKVKSLYGGTTPHSRSVSASAVGPDSGAAHRMVVKKTAEASSANSAATQPESDASSPMPMSLAVPSSSRPTTHPVSHQRNSEEGLSHSVVHNTPAIRRIPDWTARIQVKKFAVGMSFAVLIFLGPSPIPANPRDWRFSEGYVGAHHVFVNGVPERCANCRTQREMIVEGFVHLNDGIAKHSGLHSLEPDVIEPYLKANLEWRVQKVNGEAVDLTDIPSLEVAVFMTETSLPPGAELPELGEPSHRHGVTHGRVGGSRAPLE
ncbi:Tyrosinase [Mycena chlorophos]|uniref:tyrosinase n=1 Tax=Mycena chlorophos TaxID=658473 RepID=A0A8H6SA99_MYCCL|nr:Tyrosinase [Mycena chlorophos]